MAKCLGLDEDNNTLVEFDDGQVIKLISAILKENDTLTLILPNNFNITRWAKFKYKISKFFQSLADKLSNEYATQFYNYKNSKK